MKAVPADGFPMNTLRMQESDGIDHEHTEQCTRVFHGDSQAALGDRHCCALDSDEKRVSVFQSRELG